jgi:hypothetical protein
MLHFYQAMEEKPKRKRIIFVVTNNWNRMQIWEAARQNAYLGGSRNIKASIHLEAFFIFTKLNRSIIKHLFS